MGQGRTQKEACKIEGKGLVFGIQHFSIHDGSGIRSNVFLKGCPMRCRWCHNPEGLSSGPELQYFADRCTGCGSCGHIYRSLGHLSGRPLEVISQYEKRCPYKALVMVGRYMTVDEVLSDVEKDRFFFETSHGGITISGGEPMMQSDFTYRLLKTSKERGISTAIETGGYACRDCYEKVLPYVDEFLWDYKETDDWKHKELTGVGNQRILDNLHFIYDRGAAIILRCPIIPGVNDTKEHFQGIADLSRKLKDLKGVQLMPYHKMGVAKGKRLGNVWQEEYHVPTAEEKENWKQQILQMGGRLF